MQARRIVLLDDEGQAAPCGRDRAFGFGAVGFGRFIEAALVAIGAQAVLAVVGHGLAPNEKPRRPCHRGSGEVSSSPQQGPVKVVPSERR